MEQRFFLLHTFQTEMEDLVFNYTFREHSPQTVSVFSKPPALILGEMFASLIILLTTWDLHPLPDRFITVPALWNLCTNNFRWEAVYKLFMKVYESQCTFSEDFLND